MLDISPAADRTDKNRSCTDPFHLDGLEVGKPDKLGNTVREILWIGRQYAIYCSDKGVSVQFSACPETEEIQREKFTEICPELCELRYLTAQMRPARRWARSSHESTRILYDYSIAQALMLTMEDKIDAAKLLAQHTLAMAVRRATNDNTIRYFRACAICVIACLAIGTALLLSLNVSSQAGALGWRPYIVGGMAGALGALFSIVTRAQKFELKPCNESRMNYWMSTIRIITGVISAIVLLLLVDTLLSDLLAKYIGIRHLTDPIDDAVIWQPVAVLGVVAGFAERLIPTILRLAADQIESTVSKPVQAAGTPVQAAIAAGGLPSKASRP